MTKHPLLRCLALYRHMPWKFSLTALLFILVNIGMAWQLWVVGKVIHDVQLGKTVTRLADGSLDLSMAKYWLFILVAVALARGVLQYLGGVMSLIIGQDLLTILRDRILIQVQRLDLA